MEPFDRQRLLSRISAWAQAQEGIRAMALMGSSTRTDHPADEWSDLDLLLVAVDPQAYLGATDWLGEFGEIWFTFVELQEEIGKLVERRVLFTNGQDVDFLILPVECARGGFEGSWVTFTARRGLRVLWDRDGYPFPTPVESKAPLSLPLDPLSGDRKGVTQSEFSEVVNDFWFHAVWTAKKLRRGELWVALACCNDYMKRLLLSMLAWQAQAERGIEVNTWYSGRFVEQWASPWALQRLPFAFARYDEQDAWRALRATMIIFHQMAVDVAERWGFAYPFEKVADVFRQVADGLQPQDCSQGEGDHSP